MKLGMLFAILALQVLFFSGCATSKSYQISPDFSSRSGEPRRVGIVFDVHIYTQNGEDSKRSEQSLKYFEEASVRELTNNGYAVTVLPFSDDLRMLLAQYKHTRGVMVRPFSDNQGKVDGLAPLTGMVPVLGKEDIDGIVIVNGIDHLPTSTAVVGGLALSALTGVYWGANAIAYADFALLDKAGRIVFYDSRHGENYNLTNEESVFKVSSELASDLNIARQPNRVQ